MNTLPAGEPEHLSGSQGRRTLCWRGISNRMTRSQYTESPAKADGSAKNWQDRINEYEKSTTKLFCCAVELRQLTVVV